ncbi:MAG: hypothetical protein RIT04_289 [Candidatus Parcubacteria bacterium]
MCERLTAFFVEGLGVAVVANPDFHHIEVDSFSIDDSRKVKMIHTSKPMTEDGKKIFLIQANGITNEAQNALLKIFEEPQEHIHFFVVVPAGTLLLPTLRSRMMVIEGGDAEEVAGVSGVGGAGRAAGVNGATEATAFLEMPIKQRIAFVDDIAARVSDEKSVKQDAVNFLNGLERALAKRDIRSQKTRTALDAVVRAREYARDRSPSLKQLLEYVALSV